MEAMDAHRHVAPVEQCEEVGLAMTACGNQFTIDDARFCRGIATDRCDLLHPAGYQASEEKREDFVTMELQLR